MSIKNEYKNKSINNKHKTLQKQKKLSSLLEFGDGDDHSLECLYREGEWIMLTVFVVWLLFAAIQLFNLIIAIFTCNFEVMGPESLARQNLEKMFLMREYRSNARK